MFCGFGAQRAFLRSYLRWQGRRGRISETLLKERYWNVYFPCIKDSSVLFSDSIIISVKYSDGLSLLCNEGHLLLFDFSDSENLFLSYSVRIDTIDRTVSPPYNSYALVMTASEMKCEWKVIDNKWLVITPENYRNPLVFDAAIYEDRVILYLKKQK